MYWWPLGGFLAAYKGPRRLRWVLGYLVSLPLYFVTLAALYPLFGGAFRPFGNGRLLIYLSATPQLVTFSAGLISPAVLMTTGQRTWPGRLEKIAIVESRIVDVAAGSLVDAQTIYIKDGRIEEVGPPTLHPDWPRMSARGQYVVLGLIDVHVHLQSPVEVPSGFQPGFFLKSMLRDYDPQ